MLHGDQGFVPTSIASGIAAALPGRLAVLPACGHFAYLEAVDAVHAEVATFLQGA